MRLSDTRVRRRQAKLIHLTHRLPPWLMKVHRHPPASLGPGIQGRMNELQILSRSFLKRAIRPFHSAQ
jgi:hypothetical protein